MALRKKESAPVLDDETLKEQKYIDELFSQDPEIDTVVLGCTHYPLLYSKIKRYMPAGVHVVVQGSIVAASLEDYLHRHPEIDAFCSKGGQCEYRTTESPDVPPPPPAKHELHHH